MGKLLEFGSFDKLTLMCFNEQILGENDVTLRLDTWNAEFMDSKNILQKPEDKETKEDSVYALESQKNILKLWTN